MKAKIIAHRGFSSRQLENTQPAFEAADQFGVDGIECDLQMTKDGHLVIYHDADLNRLAGLPLGIGDCNLDQVQGLTLKQAGFTGTIPTLEDYLDWLQGKDLLANIEIKSHKRPLNQVEEKVVYLVQAYGLSQRVLISSFDVEILRAVKNLNPDLNLAYLVDSWNEAMLNRLASLKPDYIHIHQQILNQDRVDFLHRQGYFINTYTVNSLQAIDRMLDLGVDGIISDYPDRVADRLAKASISKLV
ncbi:Glycerophosphoryl diester phosphodiesterase [Alloiococcus otitis]|uniref:GP-PDE domain-containing protein n=1 Tax=Alloiococcus otitis ATCC 51267 TaxID=883081 RepID=K9ES99_9LACT|nr:glycerophosphodiester phosphodiesterase family protein [Alloiococcus otitis]EKU93822.1 hypothetical protein HMPREF9698_00617 [Alloiococcus otitis ATCC 51267]SUU81791.1 Glycerophosphoryl diester phosphodiesterase [Alloiococcus otitis]